MAHLELAALTKSYGAAKAVDGVSLSLEKGALICLLGPSGCGKTTTLRLIAGFVTPTSGEIRVKGRAISQAGWAEPPERRNMSMIFQSYALWPHMTVAENVGYGLTLRKLPRGDIGSRVERVLSMTRLSKLSARYPGELSGGQQQRVSCSSMNLCRTLMQACARKCALKSGGFMMSSAIPPSMSPTTRPKR
jgi:iron(III) transport system ATP-binding protein